MKPIPFQDRVTLYASAGAGGDGCASFRREKYVPRGGPDGGDGGHGGHVILVGAAEVDSLLDLYYRPHQRAEHGVRGKGKKCHGRRGRDCRVHVPRGTVVWDAEANTCLGEVLEDGQELLVARGGRGGQGNCHFVTPEQRAPQQATPGQPGEQKVLRLELKVVADVGLVGYPNAGKSTLLSRISAAHPRIASYPFTTLQPVLGTMIFQPVGEHLRVADIPGLIDGAHAGVGLGHDFLRHIERTSYLLFVLDMAGTDGRDPADDYEHLREELRQYNPELLERPSAVLANKMDLPEAELFLEEFNRRHGFTPLPLSAGQDRGLEDVRSLLYDAFFQSNPV